MSPGIDLLSCQLLRHGCEGTAPSLTSLKYVEWLIIGQMRRSHSFSVPTGLHPIFTAGFISEKMNLCY